MSATQLKQLMPFKLPQLILNGKFSAMQIRADAYREPARFEDCFRRRTGQPHLKADEMPGPEVLAGTIAI
jgi:hypothetical protein